jgi:hypothetical protein
VDPRLKPYQLEGIGFLQTHSRAALFDEAGLGKSVQALLAAVEPVLIVAPAMVLEAGNWDDQIAEWAPGIDATQVAYSSLSQKGPRGSVPRDSNGFPLTPPKAQYRRRWGTVILDESHYVKGRKTNWSVACRDLEAERIFQLTGTPIPNWGHEAFVPLQILRPEDAGMGDYLGSYWRWVKQWYEVNNSRFNPNAKEVGKFREDRTWEDFYRDNWLDRMKLRLRHEVLKDLPPLTWTGEQRRGDAHKLWRVKMTREQDRVYRELKRDFITWLESGEEITAWSTPGLLVKLAKASTGLETLGGVGSGKLKVLESLLEDRPRQTLVVSHFVASVEASAAVAVRLGKEVGVVHGDRTPAQRTAAIRAFQSGDLDVLCASLGTVSEGITLHQGGADQVIFLERSWLPSKNEQALRRLHRLGQSRPVSAIDLVTEGTVEERVLALLQEKTDEQMQALGLADYRELVK